MNVFCSSEDGHKNHRVASEPVSIRTLWRHTDVIDVSSSAQLSKNKSSLSNGKTPGLVELPWITSRQDLLSVISIVGTINFDENPLSFFITEFYFWYLKKSRFRLLLKNSLYYSYTYFQWQKPLSFSWSLKFLTWTLFLFYLHDIYIWYSPSGTSRKDAI